MTAGNSGKCRAGQKEPLCSSEHDGHVHPVPVQLTFMVNWTRRPPLLKLTVHLLGWPLKFVQVPWLLSGKGGLDDVMGKYSRCLWKLTKLWYSMLTVFQMAQYWAVY